MDISIIITSYNEEKYISEAIESALAQTHKPYEIIIIDAGSSDSSRNIINTYERKNQDIISFYLDSDYNIPEMRNFGLRKAQGDYITFLDGDDRFRPQKLAYESDIIQSTKDSKVSYSNVAYINDNGSITKKWSENRDPPSGDVLFEILTRDWPKGSLYRDELISKDFAEKIGLYNEKMLIYEDWDFKIRTAANTNISYCPQVLTEYRQHSGGISSLSNHNLYRDMTKKILINNQSIIENLDTKRQKLVKNFIKSKCCKHHAFHLAESGKQSQALKTYYTYLSRNPRNVKTHIRFFLPKTIYSRLQRVRSSLG